MQNISNNGGDEHAAAVVKGKDLVPHTYMKIGTSRFCATEQ